MKALVVCQSSGLTARSAVTAAAHRSATFPSQALLLASLANEHRISETLKARVISDGLICKVVLVLSLASIMLASAILADMLGHVLPGIVIHAFR